jgi:hypothetical protein
MQHPKMARSDLLARSPVTAQHVKACLRINQPHQLTFKTKNRPKIESNGISEIRSRRLYYQTASKFEI